jgi:hypothetical protein
MSHISPVVEAFNLFIGVAAQSLGDNFSVDRALYSHSELASGGCLDLAGGAEVMLSA